MYFNGFRFNLDVLKHTVGALIVKNLKWYSSLINVQCWVHVLLRTVMGACPPPYSVGCMSSPVQCWVHVLPPTGFFACFGAKPILTVHNVVILIRIYSLMTIDCVCRLQAN